MSDSQESPLNVLLWSLRGSGEHYNGPGSFMYRLYSLADPASVKVSLAHANPQQEPLDLFQRQDFIGQYDGTMALFRFLRKSRSWLRQNARQFDVMHALGGFHASVQPAYIAQSLGLPTVLFIANHRTELTDKPGLKGLLGLPAKRRKMIRELSGIVSMSTDIYAELRECGVARERIARIPMGVNIDRFQQVSAEAKSRLREELGLPDRPTIAFSGSVIRRKRPKLLVEALDQLVNRKKLECQLLIAGPYDQDTEYTQEIEELIGATGLQDHVHLIGFMRNIENYLQASDLFALPSEKEGMPAAMVEAMACGLPCLGTRISGIRDLIDDGNDGRIVEPTSDSVAEAIAQYLNDSTLLSTHAARCQAKATERYSAAAVLAAHVNLFRTVIAGGNACDASILPDME